MRKKTLTIALTVLLAVPVNLLARPIRVKTAAGKTVEAVPNQVLVRYRKGRKSEVQNQLFQRFQIRGRQAIPSLDIETLSVPTGKTVESFAAELRSNPDVEYAEPNGIMKAFLTPSDPLYNTQYSLKAAFIDAPEAWDITLGDPGIVVAVVDTGVTLTHPDLQPSLWNNPSPAGTSGPHGTVMEIDWDDNGNCSGTNTGPDFEPEQCDSPDPTDNDSFDGVVFHGTRVASIIAAADNGIGMVGVAPHCKIMAVKALDSAGFGTFSSIARGVTYAADNGASVINLSLGGPESSQAILDAINYALDKNVVVVAAAGNDGNSTPINFPANIERVIAVGATTETNSLASFSCTGRELDLVAPGVGILSANPPANYSSTIGGQPASGTSFAAPMVAGVVALIRSLNPTLSIDNVTKYIDFTATDLGRGGFDTQYGYGLLNAKRAVQSAQSGTIYTSSPADPGDTFFYPNPFRPAKNPVVTISVPQSLGSENLKIRIINVLGQKIKELENTITWDGVNDDGTPVAAGFYFFFVETSKGNAKGKLTVIR